MPLLLPGVHPAIFVELLGIEEQIWRDREEKWDEAS
jgi:hypothetical protein